MLSAEGQAQLNVLYWIDSVLGQHLSTDSTKARRIKVLLKEMLVQDVGRYRGVKVHRNTALETVVKSGPWRAKSGA